MFNEVASAPEPLAFKLLAGSTSMFSSRPDLEKIPVPPNPRLSTGIEFPFSLIRIWNGMLGNNFASLALWFNLYYFWVGAGFIYLAPRRSALSARGCPHGSTFAAHYS